MSKKSPAQGKVVFGADVAARKQAEKALAKQQSEKDAYYQPGEAAEFYRQKRVPDGEADIPVERYLEARDQMRALPRYSTAKAGFLPSQNDSAVEAEESLGSWTPLGPGNIGGRTRALLIHPTQPNVMYAAGVTGGVWKTINGGTSWTPLTDLLPNIAVSALAMDPKNPDIIYAGTGEGVTQSFRGAGVFKTTNGGANWTQLPGAGGSNFFFINDLIINPHGSQRIYAATSNGVWRSNDGGTSFIRVLNPNVNGGCFDLAIRTDQLTDYLFASCGTSVQARIFRNTDAGNDGSWQEVYSELGGGRTSLAIAPSNQNIIYAISAEYLDFTYRDGLHAVVRSTSSGDVGSWTTQVTNKDATRLNTMLLSNPFVAFQTECGLGESTIFSQGWFDNVIAVDPLDPERVWVGGIDLFRSDDGGRNWGLASHWWADVTVPQYAHADQHVIVFHPEYNGTTNRTMFVGGDGGIFRTDDARAVVATGNNAACNPANSNVRWLSLNNNYSVTQFYHGAVSPEGTTWIGGTQDNGTLRGSEARGLSGWQEILGGDGGVTAIDPLNPNVLFASTPGIGIRKSTNGGAHFTSARFGISDSGLFVSPWLTDPSDAQRMWLGGTWLWRSLTGAANWTRVGSYVPSGSSSEGFSAIAIAPTDSNYLLAGTSRGFIVRSDRALSADEKTIWQSFSPRFGFVSSVTFDPTNKNIAYATFSTFGGQHVWRSLDAGVTWTAIDGTGAAKLPEIPVHSLIVDPTNTARLYIGTDLGVFVTNDGGASWAVENTGFANVVTESLVLNTVNGVSTLFAFTHGRGVWRVPLGSGCQYSVAPATQEFKAIGGNGEATVNVSPNSCPWNASSNADWITVIATTNNKVSFTVAANAGTTARAGTVTVGQRNFTINQAGNADAIAPVLRILAPIASDIFRTEQQTITLRGTATDNVAVTQVTWATDTGVTGAADSTTNWTIPDLTLHSGLNTITVTARDAVGNTGTASFRAFPKPAHSLVTIAGTGLSGTPVEGQPRLEAPLNSVLGQMVADADGNIYFADAENNRIRKLSFLSGRITTYAGTGSPGTGGDGGAALQAQLNAPRYIAMDRSGNLFIADSSSHRVRRVAANTGIITTVAGKGSNGFSGDGGAATEATLNRPLMVATDRQGNLYFFDADNRRIRKVTISTGVITTVAGNGNSGPPMHEKTALESPIDNVSCLALDSVGNLYFHSNEALWKVTVTNGLLTRLTRADNPPQVNGIQGDGGPLAQARINSASSLFFDEADNLWIVRGLLRRVDARTGIINTIAGGGFLSEDTYVNGILTDNAFGRSALDISLSAFSLVFDPFGNPIVGTTGRMRRIVPFLEADNEAPIVSFDHPSTEPVWTSRDGFPNIGGTVTDNRGVKYFYLANDRTTSRGGLTSNFSGRWSNSVQLQPGANRLTVTAIDGFGNSSTASQTVIYSSKQAFRVLAGNQRTGFVGENVSGLTAQLWSPSALALDNGGNLYIADTGNHRIRRITRSGLISTMAGSGALGFGGDGGQATNALLSAPRGVAVDAAGNVYLADTGNHRIRKVTPAGVITTIAGTGSAGSAGDDGAAVTAQLNSPSGLALDAAGNLYIADTGNHRIRKITATTGIITTVAGGRFGYSGDGGNATQAALKRPRGIALDNAGNLYIADTDNHCIRKVTTAGVISTVAGNGSAGNCCFQPVNGNGSVFNSPTGVAVDEAGNLLVADSLNNWIRKINPSGEVSVVESLTEAFTETGVPVPTTFKLPAAVVTDRGGSVFVADTDNHRVAAILPVNAAVTVEAASYSGPLIASEAIVAAFGTELAASAQAAETVPLPTTLNGTIVKVRDSAGVERLAPLFFVSPNQVNYQIPAGTAPGLATVFIINSNGRVSTSYFEAASVSPGLFTADTSGKGLPTAQALRVRQNGSLSYEPVARFDSTQNKFVPVPVELGAESDQVFLVMYGTGLRGRSAESAVTATIGDEPAEVLYTGSQGGFVGLDQVNVRIPRSVIGRGDVEVRLILDGRPVNIVRINVAGTVCNLSVAPATQSFAASGGSGTINLTGAPGCYWTAQSTVNWISVNTAGSGNASVDFSVAANASVFVRTGMIRVTGQTVTITQAGKAESNPPTIAITRPTASGSHTTDNFTLSIGGTATANPAVSHILWSNDRGGNGFASGTTDWSFNEAKLQLGTNQFTVTIVDLLGRSATAKINVTFRPTLVLQTVAGGGTAFPGDNLPATQVSVNANSLAFDAADNLFLTGFNRIRKVDGNGIITTIGNTGVSPIENYRYAGLLVDRDGNVYVSDTMFHRIRKFSPTGNLTAVAGASGTPSNGGYSGDGGIATEARLASPRGLALDSAGNLYIADSFNHRIRKVNLTTGIITTFAGGGDPGAANDGDGGSATQAVLSFPTGLAFDRQGNLFIAERNGARIRKVAAGTEIITTFASNLGNTNPASDIIFIATDPAGNVYLPGYGLVRKIAPDGTIKIIAGALGGGINPPVPNGTPATQAQLGTTLAVALGSSGNVYFIESLSSGGSRIHKLVPIQ